MLLINGIAHVLYVHLWVARDPTALSDIIAAHGDLGGVNATRHLSTTTTTLR
jgi:hypothetical protein